MAISISDRQKIKNADPMQVVSAFSMLRPFKDRRFKNWLDNSNRYKVDTIKSIDLDIKNNSVVDLDMREYIAASGILHCYDGWKYLGAAIQAVLNGDPDLVRHMAYYAELRASMSLLATQGIGIFNNKHYAVHSNGQVVSFSAGVGKTHVAVWELLNAWSQEKSYDVTKLFRLHGKTLDEWIDAYYTLTHAQGTPAKSLFLKQWIRDWGVDLANISADKNSRNESSYRPVDLNRRNLVKTSRVLETIDNLWRLSQPQSSSSNFQTLDMYLIKRALIKLHQNDSVNLKTLSGKKQYRKNIDQIYENMLGVKHQSVTKSYMRRTTLAHPLVVVLAEKNTGFSTVDLCVSDHHLSVLARAYLLLRMATGAVEQQLHQSGHSSEDLGFWWKKNGESHGLWDQGNEPAHFEDLWADVEYPLEEIAIAQAELTSYTKICERQKAGIDNGISMHVLSQCHRIGLWGLLS